MKRILVGLAFCALALGAWGCSFPDEESRLRIDDLESRVGNLEGRMGAEEEHSRELQRLGEERDQSLDDLTAEVRAQAHERLYEEEHQEIWDATVAAARCYVTSDPSVGRNYPDVPPERLVETVAAEMYEKYRVLVTEGGVETSRILEVVGGLQALCGP